MERDRFGWFGNDVSRGNEAAERRRTSSERRDFTIDVLPEQAERLESWIRLQKWLWDEALKQRGAKSPTYEERKEQGRWLTRKRKAHAELRGLPKDMQSALLVQMNSARDRNNSPRPPAEDSLDWPLLRVQRRVIAVTSDRVDVPHLGVLQLLEGEPLPDRIEITRACIARVGEGWRVAIFFIDGGIAG